MSDSRGFSLIEVLIAVFVISVGLLALALLQARALQFSQASYERSVAVVQANDLVERLWVGACALPDDFEDIRDDWAAVHEGSLSNWNGDNSTVDDTVTPPLYTIKIEWKDERVVHNVDNEDEPHQSFVYYARVPKISC